MEWPPQSSDLSPIENTEADLEEAVFSAWISITFEKILHFIDPMPERINEVIEKNGHVIHY
ncbi:6900_t:CDS:2 [Ambispora gerdemannii]|uniref:6900_t:CDS:1 n=1 Tax=Ambispora gerdemannii TaxID=144530 RepID=A0A9N9GTV6_9GLOM|nr:6900_t:CDS:2 [Ambispora gerdemannii]